MTLADDMVVFWFVALDWAVLLLDIDDYAPEPRTRYS